MTGDAVVHRMAPSALAHTARAAGPCPRRGRPGSGGRGRGLAGPPTAWALLMAWACGGPRASTAVVDARRGDVAVAIAWQAAAWPADLIVLTRRGRPALTRLARGSVPDQVRRKASCPVLALPPAKMTASTAPPDRWHTESGRRPS